MESRNAGGRGEEEKIRDERGEHEDVRRRRGEKEENHDESVPPCWCCPLAALPSPTEIYC